MTLASDCRAAFRGVLRSRMLPTLVVLILAVAIGAVTAIFSIAHAVLFRPLPVTDPDRIVLLWGRDEARSQSVVEVSLGDLRAWRAGQNSLTAIEVFGSVNWGELRITAPGEPFGASMNAVSGGFFDVLGARPLLGRTFTPDEDQPNAAGVVVLSEDLWRRRFSSNPDIVGTVLTVGEGEAAKPYEVIGVMPHDFRIPAGAEVWITLSPVLAAAAKEQNWDLNGLRAMYAVGRLAPGATAQAAVAELSTIARNEMIKEGIKDTAMVVVATPLVAHLLGPARPALLAIGGAAGMLLLIACANAAGLLLLRGASRGREVAVRLALGARRWQIVRQFLCESLLLALVAGLLGVAVAYVSFDAIVALAPIEVPRLEQAAIDLQALLFALGVSVGAALAAGLLPAWRSSRNPIASLHQRSQSGTGAPASARARKVLVTAQVAAAVLLLTGAGLFVRSYLALLRLDLGFDPHSVLTFHVTAPDSARSTKERQWALVDDVLERAGRLPNAVAAGAVYLRPFAHGPIGMDANVLLEGEPINAESSLRNPIVNWEVATPDYFRAMDIRLVRGRLFDERDTEAAPPVIIVSEALAGRLWPGQNPLGRRLLTHGAPGDTNRPGWQTVVGVVESARYREVDVPRFDLYLPYRQAPDSVQHFVIRVAGDPIAIVPELRAAVGAIGPDIKVEGITTMGEIVGRAFAPWRFSTVVVSVFSLMAVTFAAVGLAALVGYAVTQRTREIGVRMALGARPRDVVSLLLQEALWMIGGGVAAGLLAAWISRRSVQSLLFGVSPGDGVTFGSTAALLVLIAMIAVYVPARRAALIDPAAALRSD